MRNIYKYIYYTVVCLFITCISVPEGSAQTAMSYTGSLSTGLYYEYQDSHTRKANRAKIEFNVNIKKNIKGQIDIRNRKKTNEIYLKGAWIKLRSDSPVKIKIGSIKKRFGFEETFSKDELYTIDTSIINRHMEYFGYVIRGQGVEIYRKYKGEGHPYSFNTGAYYHESQNYYFSGRMVKHNFPFFDHAGVSGILRFSLLNSKESFGAFGIDVSKSVNSMNFEAELFYGDDTDATAFRRLSGRWEKVNFLGFRSLIRKEIKLNKSRLRKIEPLVMFCYLAPDTESLDVHQLQSLLGLNLYVTKKTRFRINGDMVLSNNPVEKDKYYYTDSRVSSEFQIRW